MSLIPGFRIDKIWGKSGFLKKQYRDRYFQVVYKFIDLAIQDLMQI